MSAHTNPLVLADTATRDDLQNYLSRLVRFGQPEVRLQSRGAVLAVYGCTQAPVGIMDDAPVVLVMRAFTLEAAPETPVDTVVEVRALTDRLAREEAGMNLVMPDVTVAAAWAGVLPPVSGWEPRGAIDAGSLAVVAAEGMARVAENVPQDAGDPVVQKVRRQVWGSEIAPGIPAAAAFAAEGLGFLAGADRLTLSGTKTWTRLSGRNGHVILRRGVGLMG